VTEPRTFLPDWFGFPFRVSLDRWRWRLGELDGDTVLVPEKRLRTTPFVGDAELLDRLIELANADDQSVERFANRFTGLFATSPGPPLPEVVDAIRSEAVVLMMVRKLGQAGSAGARIQTSGVGTALLPRLDAARREGAEALRDTLSDMRPLGSATGRPGLQPARLTASRHDRESAEWQILEWVAKTVDETWTLRVPVDDWLAEPMHRRRWKLAEPMPEVRCLTLLGYAYAQLVAQLQSRSAKIASGRPLLCGSCGGLMPYRGVSGRRRRSDAKWCDDCRKRKNAERQDARRASHRAERTARRGGPST
jgi:hypothetical protein